MLKIKDPSTGDVVRIKWNHHINPYFGKKTKFITVETPESEEPLLKKVDTKTPSETVCLIETGTFEEPQVLGASKAIQAAGDQFSRSIGRKIALSRALPQADFSKEFRKLIWQKYQEMQGGKY